MSTIKVICIDRALAFENTPLIASGGMDEDFVSFTFCKEWTGYERTAVFWRSETEVYHVRLNETDACQIPPEVTTDEGTIYFGVFGVTTEGKQRTSNVLTYHIAKGAITVGTMPSDPTPDIYTQFLAEVGIVKGLVQETRDAEKNFEEKMNTDQAAFMTAVNKAQQDFMDAAERTQATYKQEIAEAAAAGLVPDGTITTARLADAAVTPAKLADAAVTPEKLSAQAVSYILGKGVSVAVGSYIGTGLYGAANPNTLKFPFRPDVVFISDANGRSLIYSFFRGRDVYGYSGDMNGLTLWNSTVLSWESDGLTWYNTGGNDNDFVDARLQANTENMTFNYIAFGLPAEEVTAE